VVTREVPAAHAVHATVLVAKAYWPAAQGVQTLLARAEEKRPAAQLLHTPPRPVTDEYKPAPHPTQLVD
jgi:hypothetical protein